MTVEDQFLDILSTKSKIRHAILSQGVYLPEDMMFDRYPDMIRAIEGHVVKQEMSGADMAVITIFRSIFRLSGIEDFYIDQNPITPTETVTISYGITSE